MCYFETNYDFTMCSIVSLLGIGIGMFATISTASQEPELACGIIADLLYQSIVARKPSDSILAPSRDKLVIYLSLSLLHPWLRFGVLHCKYIPHPLDHAFYLSLPIHFYVTSLITGPIRKNPSAIP
jgi:hypothetical protein